MVISAVLVFVWQLSLPAESERLVLLVFGAVPDFLSGRSMLSGSPLSVPLSLLTAPFFHVNVFHLLLNVPVIWTLGASVERATGWRRFTLLLLAAAVSAALWYTVLAPRVQVPLIGFGYVSASLFGATLILTPTARIVFPRLAIGAQRPDLPLWLVALVWLGLQEVVARHNALATNGGWVGIAPGFVLGAILILFLKQAQVIAFRLD